MIGFVTSLPHPECCVSYRARSEMFLDTLRSILNQDEPDFRLVIVANEPPDCQLPDDMRIKVVKVGFPPATRLGRPSLAGIEADKGAKLGVGSSVAMQDQPSHLMFVDSDDFIHRGIARLAGEHPDAAGWFADSGYLHRRGARSMHLITHGFHQVNGSSHVMRSDILAVPDDIALETERDDVITRIGRGVPSNTMGRHRPIVGFFEALGTPLSPFPFPAAIWEIGTGENSSRVLAGGGARVRLSADLARDFAIAIPGRGAAAVEGLRSSSTRIARKAARLTSVRRSSQE